MDLNKIGKFIVKLRKEKNLTQIQLADMVGASDKAVSKWEKGNGFPDLCYQAKLCEALEIYLEELHNGEFNIERRKRHKRRKIINRAITIYASITIPLIIFLCLFFINNYDSTKIYLLETENKFVELTISGTLVETNQTNMLYIGNINLLDYTVLDSDTIEVEIYSNKELIYNTNQLSNLTVKYFGDIDEKNLIIKVIVTNKNKDEKTYQAKMKLTDISKDNKIKIPITQDLQLLDEEKIIKNLKDNGFKQNGEEWTLNKKNKKLNETIIYFSKSRKLYYDSVDGTIIKNVKLNLQTNILTVCIYNQDNNEQILFEKYIYNYNNEKLDCQVGVCSSIKNILQTLEIYKTLLIVE